jgi:hypothetical protein
MTTDLGMATNKTLLELYNMMKNGSLKLQPSFQRKLVWNNNHKENFIETILLKLPFPEVYLAYGDIDLETKTSTQLVVDGQQRLSTILQYVLDAPEFDMKRIKHFSQLSPKEQTDFFNYKVVVRDLGLAPDAVIKEIFKRINSVQYALNAVEIENALYEGEFISTAKDIVDNIVVVSGLFDVFNEIEFTRMKDVEFVLLVMSTIEEGGYFAQGRLVDDYVRKYDAEYPNKELMKTQFEKVFKLISDCKLKSDSMWFRKSGFFTLIVELLKYCQSKSTLPKSKALCKLLNDFEANVYDAKANDIKKDNYASYYSYMFQNTNGRTGRVIRGNLLMEHLKKLR